MEPAWNMHDWAWDPVGLAAVPRAGPCAPKPDPAAAIGASQLAAVNGSGALVAGCLTQALQISTAGVDSAPVRKLQKACCQVPGCTSDLQSSRAYYRRYRICEAHFRMPSFVLPSILNGVVARFCQQCAKFEPLTEFEGDKRSCRRQLNRHNERRKGRKEAAAARQQVGSKRPAEGSACSGAEDGDPSGESHGGRIVEGTLAAMLESSSLHRNPAGSTDADKVPAIVQSSTGGAPTRDESGSQRHDGYVLGHSAIPNVAATSPHTLVQGHGLPSRAGSVSEITVEVQHSKPTWEVDDGLDAMLTVAAQELLAHWQHEVAADTVGREIGASSDGAQLATNPPPPHGADLQLSALAAVAADQPAFSAVQAAVDPPTGDSSVHGPPTATLPQIMMMASADNVVTDRVLDALGLSHRFDAMRADSQPLVRDVHGAAQMPSCGRSHTAEPHSHTAQQPSSLRPQHSGPQAVNPPSAVHAAMLRAPGPVCHAAHGLGGATGPEHVQQPGGLPMTPVSGMDASMMPCTAAAAGFAHVSASPPACGGPAPSGSPAGLSQPMPLVASSPSIPPPWLSAHWNATAAALRSRSDLSSAASSHSDVFIQGYPWPTHTPAMHRMHSSDTSALSFSPSPQVPLHPLLASLPSCHESAPQQAAPVAMPPHPRTYPNVWSTPCPLPASLSSVLSSHGAPTLSRLSGASGKAERAGTQLSSGGPFDSSTLARNLSQAQYILAEQSLTRLSIKLHGVTPEALPQELRSALTDWLAATDVRLLQGFIRPGCVHLSLDCVVVSSSSSAVSSEPSANSSYTGSGCSLGSSACRGGGGSAGGVRGLDDLLTAGLATAGGANMASALPRPLARLFSSCTIVELQSPAKLVLMEGEAVWSVAALDKRPSVPVINNVQPLAILAGAHARTPLYVQGSYLEGRASQTATDATPAAGGCHVLVRSAGRFFQQGQAQAVASPDGVGNSSGAADPSRSGWWRAEVDTADMQPGLAVVECQNGRLLSNWRPVLVLDDAGVHREVLQLQSVFTRHQDKVSAIITNLALLLQLNTHHCEMVAALAAAAAAAAPTPAKAATLGPTRHLWVRHGRNSVESESESDSQAADLDSDDDDGQSQTAPSVSEGPDEDGLGFEGEQEVQGPLNNNNNNEAAVAIQARLAAQQQPPHHPPPAALGIAVSGVRGSAARMMSWDSETFASAGVSTPAMHSSWGSTVNSSMLAKADVGSAMPVTPRRAPLSVSADNLLERACSTQLHERVNPVSSDSPSTSDASPFTAEVRASLAAHGVRLLAFACDAGWPCTVRLLLDLLTTLPLLPPPMLAGQPAARLSSRQLIPLSYTDVLSKAVAPDGLTPLHRAARSGSAATVREVLNFARHSGLSLNPAARGGAVLSPLHLSVTASNSDGTAALALLQAAHDMPLQWFVARAADGRTPAQYAATSAGCKHVNEQARWLVQMLAAGCPPSRMA